MEELNQNAIPENETIENEVAESAAPEEEIPVKTVSKRVNKKGERRGRHRFAAVLGLVMVLLSLVGLATVIRGAVTGILKLTDNTPLRNELYDYVEPMVVNTPIKPFDSAAEADQDTLLLATFYRITQDESIRMLVEKDDTSQYEVDDQGRLIVPITSVLPVWESLFGKETPFPYRTVGEAGTLYAYEYVADKNCYYLPTGLYSSLYSSLPISLKKAGGNYVLKVGLVAINDLGYDNKGNQLAPTEDKVSYYEIYTIAQTTDEDGETVRRIVSVAVEEP